MKKKLGEILVEAGAIDSFQLQAALGHQKQWGGRLGEVLVEKSFLTADALVQCLANQLGLERTWLDPDSMDRNLAQLVPRDLADRHGLVPTEAIYSGDRMTGVVIAVSDPTNIVASDEVQFHSGKRVQLVVATPSEIEMGIKWIYDGIHPAGVRAVDSQGGVELPEDELPEAEVEEIELTEVENDMELVSGQTIPNKTESAPPTDITLDMEARVAAVMDALDVMATGEPAPEDERRWVNPTQMVATLVRLLIKKGVIEELEFVEELQKK